MRGAKARLLHVSELQSNRVVRLASGQIKLTTAIARILGRPLMSPMTPIDELKGDLSAWRRIEREMTWTCRDLRRLINFFRNCSYGPRNRFLRRERFRSRRFMARKDREFDTVYLIGLAEEVLAFLAQCEEGRRKRGA